MQSRGSFKIISYPITKGRILLLAGLLTPPITALLLLRDQSIQLFALGGIFGVSLLTYFIVAGDKRKAQLGQWRVPESALHFWELLGGWPGSFLAQRRFRHKTSKLSYQIVFWLIVALHEYLAIDCLRGGAMASSLLQAISDRG